MRYFLPITAVFMGQLFLAYLLVSYKLAHPDPAELALEEWRMHMEQLDEAFRD